MDLTALLTFLHVAMSSVVIILAFSLLAYTLTYNFRIRVGQLLALVLACVVVAYTGDVALSRVDTAASAARWLRLQWLGIALLPVAYYVFSLAVLETTNFRIQRQRWVAWIAGLLSVAAAASAMFGTQIVGEVRYRPPISYLDPGPLFEIFALFYVAMLVLSLGNVWKARTRCLTDRTRQRMSYLLVAFVGPGIGMFPYLVSLSRVTRGTESEPVVLLLSIAGNAFVAAMLVLMAYTVAYFGVLTPDRVVRYRLVRFFARGPAVAILVILAIQTLPRVERLLGLPRDMVLFSVITGVIVLSQLALSVTKSLVDEVVYREDREEIAWLRELDRRLLTTSDVQEFLENNLVALCELLRVPAGFVASVSGPDLMLEVVVGPDETREQVMAVGTWGDALAVALKKPSPVQPLSHGGFWIWPLLEPNQNGGSVRALGILGVRARTETPLLSQDEMDVLDQMVERVARALLDRQLQMGVFVNLRRIIPDIDRIQQIRNVAPYLSADAAEPAQSALLNPSPIHSPEFEAWVKDALSHYWGGPKLTRSPLVQLRTVAEVLDQADGNPTKALRLVLGAAIEKLRPDGKQSQSAPEWLLYNILEMRFIQGRKVRDIAERLAISESDLYRKQRVAIGQLARVLTEMEQGGTGGPAVLGGSVAQRGTDTLPVGVAEALERTPAGRFNADDEE